MGAGASAGVTTAVEAASKEELKSVVKDLKGKNKEKLLDVLATDEATSEKPTLYYLPIAARGEVARLIGKFGGLDFEDCLTDGSDLDKKSFGSPSGLPVLKHGDYKISQSYAIMPYITSITPKYAGLTPQQKCKDMQFNAMMDDMISDCVPKFFGKDPEMKEKIGAGVDKWFTVLEAITPESGFVNGLSFPTGADFVVLVMNKGYTPFKGLYKIAEMDPFEKYPKLKALVDRTMEVPEVKALVEASKTMDANPLGFP